MARKRCRARIIGRVVGDGFRQDGPMSASIRSYQDLLVWKKGMLLIDEIDHIVDQFDSYRRWWIGPPDASSCVVYHEQHR
jgi:hypothetical protein